MSRPPSQRSRRTSSRCRRTRQPSPRTRPPWPRRSASRVSGTAAARAAPAPARSTGAAATGTGSGAGSATQTSKAVTSATAGRRQPRGSGTGTGSGGTGASGGSGGAGTQSTHTATDRRRTRPPSTRRRGRADGRRAVPGRGQPHQSHQRDDRLGRHQRRRHRQRQLEHRLIIIIGTQSLRGDGTLASSQVPSVKVGPTRPRCRSTASTAPSTARCPRWAPSSRATSGYTYPVVVALPSSATGLFTGSTANVVIATGAVSNVVAVPTSAVQSLGSRSFVETLSSGT